MTAAPRHRPLRSHQAQVDGLVAAMARGELDGVRDVLAAVTPGGGKSLLPGLADYEPGHTPGTADPDEASSWSRALLPLLEYARVRLLLSGTLERADGRAVLWLPYRAGLRPGTRRVDMDALGWAVVGYSHAQAVADRAVLPVTFGALDGEVTWSEPLTGGAEEDERITVGPHRLSPITSTCSTATCATPGALGRGRGCWSRDGGTASWQAAPVGGRPPARAVSAGAGARARLS